MGMDVYGLKPTDKVGEYFRRNVWGWHPLWDYCLDLHPDIAGKVEHGHSNDGDGLGAVNSKKLANRLKADIKSGVAKKYIEDREQAISQMPQQICWLCKGETKIFTEVSLAPFVEKLSVSLGCSIPAPTDTKPSEEQQQRDCHVCSATGFVDPWEKNYFLELEDIVEFSKFLEACGGFQIF